MRDRVWGFLLLAFVVSLLFLNLPASADMRYVNSVNSTPVAPYTNWQTAATTIQDAVDVANAGDIILVTNGAYAAGGAFAAGQTNRVAITKAMTIRSVNGSEATIIEGQGPMGDAAVRCAYLSDGAMLVGFTLTNGFSPGLGGGVYCTVRAAIISDCTLSGNIAAANGGGAFGGTLYNCILIENSAGNWGGGASDGTLYNCALIGNSANSGGGAFFSYLYNCTLTGNSANDGGGIYCSWLCNCIVYYNIGANYDTNFMPTYCPFRRASM